MGFTKGVASTFGAFDNLSEYVSISNKKQDGSPYSKRTMNPAHALVRYLQSEIATTAHYNEETRCYNYTKGGREIECGGIHSFLRQRFYSHHRSNRSERKHKQTSIIGSSAAQGKLVDSQIQAITLGKKPKRLHKLTVALLDWWKERGHTVHAAQVPVELAQGYARMTQADVITQAPDGRLWVWEVKTGWPVGFYHSQGNFASAPLRDIPCTQENIWYLQLHYTHQALVTCAALPIDLECAGVLQVYQKKVSKTKGAQILVEQRSVPEWLRTRVPLLAPPTLGLGVPVLLKKRPVREEEEQDQ